MTTNELGRTIIQGIETCQLAPYKDLQNKGYWTIGWGHKLEIAQTASIQAVRAHLIALGLMTTGDVKISQATADALFTNDLLHAENTIRAHVRVPLTHNEFSALVSLVYNIGSGNFATSTLLKYLNAGNKGAAQEEFHVWRKSGGSVQRGLERRRAVEAWLFGLKVDFQPVFQWVVDAGGIDAATIEKLRVAPKNSVVVLVSPSQVAD